MGRGYRGLRAAPSPVRPLRGVGWPSMSSRSFRATSPPCESHHCVEDRSHNHTSHDRGWTLGCREDEHRQLDNCKKEDGDEKNQVGPTPAADEVHRSSLLQKLDSRKCAPPATNVCGQPYQLANPLTCIQGRQRVQAHDFGAVDVRVYEDHGGVLGRARRDRRAGRRRLRVRDPCLSNPRTLGPPPW